MPKLDSYRCRIFTPRVVVHMDDDLVVRGEAYFQNYKAGVGAIFWHRGEGYVITKIEACEFRAPTFGLVKPSVWWNVIHFQRPTHRLTVDLSSPASLAAWDVIMMTTNANRRRETD